MAETKLKNTNCLRVTLAALMLTGVWYPNFIEKSPFVRRIYYLYAVCYHCIIIYPLIGIEVMRLFSVIGDVAAMMDVIKLLLIHFAMLPKIYIIWYRQFKIKYLLHLFDSEKFTRVEPEKKAILDKMTNEAYLVSVIFMNAILLAGIFWGVYPLINTLDLPLGYPDMDNTSWAFISMYIYQAVSITIIGFGAGSADLLVGGTMALAVGELDLLYYELSNIGHNVHNSKDMYPEAVSCVKFHEDIIALVNEINKSFSLPLLFQFMASSIVVCAVVFKISIIDDPVEIVAMWFYFVCVITELLVFCYYGEIIREKSINVAQAAYYSNWTEMSRRTRLAIMLIMVRSQRPLSLTAGNMFDVTITTFTKVLRSSYSYFALLNQCRSEEIYS